MANSAAPEKFQVNLSGIVGLLSQHLYSGPQVYMRELLQNCVDAITAARQEFGDFPAKILLDPATANDPVFTIYDNGIGLTADQARELLATIGQSSKRDELFDTGRAEFLGQFGIGLLATFMIAQEVVVISRSRHLLPDGNLPPAICWRGNANGTFTVTELSSNETPQLLATGGTIVKLSARPEMRDWVTYETVSELALHYGDLLPQPLQIKTPAGQVRQLNTLTPPWLQEYADSDARKAALNNYCQELFDFQPLACIDLSVPMFGLSGVAFVLPQQVAPGSGQHLVYLQNMLLGERVSDILPDWAFFVRAVINTDALSPTASREQLHADEKLLLAREELAKQLLAWITDTLENPTPAAAQFLQTHHLALQAVALESTDMLELIATHLPYETCAGQMPLAAAKNDTTLFYTQTVEQFRAIQAVARAAGLTVVNGGYAYGQEIMQALRKQLNWNVEPLQNEQLASSLLLPSADRELATANSIAATRAKFSAHGVDVLLRAFTPESVPALFFTGSDGFIKQQLNSFLTPDSDDMWAGLLNDIAGDLHNTDVLVLNDNAPVVQALLNADTSSDVFAAGLQALYFGALALGGQGFSGAQSAQLGESLHLLLNAALEKDSND